MSDLIQIPPIVRTVLYYALALGNAVVAAGFVPDSRWSSLILGLAGVFGFTLAAQHVPAGPAGIVTLGEISYEEPDYTDPGDQIEVDPGERYTEEA